MTTQTTTERMLEERYGRRRSRRNRILGWSVVALLAATVTLGLGWTTVTQAMNAVDAQDTRFAVVDEHRVSVSFQVSAPPGRAIACALEARDEEHGVVGWRIIEYPASDQHSRAFTEEIPTLALATTGFVNSCWVP